MEDKLLILMSFFKENIYLYMVFSLFIYFLGGLDETLVTLFFFNFINLMLNLVSKEKSKISSKVRMYIVIMLGVSLDRILNLDNNYLRNYMLFYYSYNELIEIIHKLNEDKSLKIPNKLKQFLKILENKTNN